MNIEIRPIAHIENDFTTKFGIPRQPGLVDEIESRIIFEKEYRIPDALRGIDGYSHIWLIWEFSENIREDWSPTVRPPRLGGNIRMGVFATRSPFRPNNLGLSCVKLLRIEQDTEKGTMLIVSGADLMNGTPIFDIKPYLPYSDCIPEASEGYSPSPLASLKVVFNGDTASRIPADKLPALEKLLSYDPRPHYQKDPERIYGFSFAGMEIKFYVKDDILTVSDVENSGN